MSDAEPKRETPAETTPLGDNTAEQEQAYEQAEPAGQPATSSEPEPDDGPPDAG